MMQSDLPRSDSILRGKFAVVTGSSRGIGREIALAFSQSGAEVLVHGGHCQTALDETVADIREQGGVAFSALADLSSTNGREALLNRVLQHGRVPDIWVNNAGVDVLTGSAAKDEYFSRLTHLWEVDVYGTLFLAKSVGQLMRRAGHGSIINIGWDQVEWGMEGESGELFGAIKGAVIGFSRSLAKTLAPVVRVNCISPGWIKTAWGESASEEWQERAQRESLSERWGTPRDVADVALFLASPSAAFVTGQTIAVNGGRR